MLYIYNATSDYAQYGRRTANIIYRTELLIHNSKNKPPALEEKKEKMLHGRQYSKYYLNIALGAVIVGSNPALSTMI